MYSYLDWKPEQKSVDRTQSFSYFVSEDEPDLVLRSLSDQDLTFLSKLKPLEVKRLVDHEQKLRKLFQEFDDVEDESSQTPMSDSDVLKMIDPTLLSSLQPDLDDLDSPPLPPKEASGKSYFHSLFSIKNCTLVIASASACLIALIALEPQDAAAGSAQAK